MPIYYHVSTVTHPPGFVIPHGRFGSLFTNRPATVEDGFVMTWEAVLETARRLVAPTAPSRLNCLFACDTLSAAKTFQSNYRKAGTILKVEVGIEVPTFSGNFDLISSAQGGSFIERWASNAIQYWGEPHDGMVEVVIGGPVTVVEPIFEGGGPVVDGI